MAKILCDKCKRKCRGDVLRVSDKYFHKDCFKCSKCYTSLKSGGFFMKNDEFYCQNDYQLHFISKCKICSQELVGEIVTVLNFSFHRDCFRCTGCSMNFNPGDRVTVWHEKFFCPSCINQECVTVSTPSGLGTKFNGVLVSPILPTDDEGCISALDGSSSELPSPQSTGRYGLKDKSVKLRVVNNGTDGVVRMEPKASGLPQKAKSILRKSSTDHSHLTASRDKGYISADSGLGDRNSDPKPVHTPTISTNQTQSNIVNGHAGMHCSSYLSSHQSHQSLHSRVPNSDYGRFYNQSYMNFNVSTPSSQHADKYRKNVSSSNLAITEDRPKHFHIPQKKNRFLPAGHKFASMLFGQPTTYGDSRTCSSYPNTAPAHPNPRISHSAMELNYSQSTDKQQPISTEMDVTSEVRKLASYPSGQQRDNAVPVPIERYDWPAPPASAVILAELMRERRCRRRDQHRVNGDLGDREDGDFESQEALSIDESVCGPSAKSATSYVHTDQTRTKSYPLDPISSSRSPNAATEPSYKPRYATHQFTCQSVRPGYTGGRLSESRNPQTLPASALNLDHRSDLSSGEGRMANGGWYSRSMRTLDPIAGDSNRDLMFPVNRPYYRSLHTLNNGPPTDSTGRITYITSPTRITNSSGDLLKSSTDQLSYPTVLYPPASNSAFLKAAPPPPKSIPYEELKMYQTKAPKGVDRTALETHLTDEEFTAVFQLPRPAFYRLPEWKRNDLKRRVHLF